MFITEHLILIPCNTSRFLKIQSLELLVLCGSKSTSRCLVWIGPIIGRNHTLFWKGRQWVGESTAWGEGTKERRREVRLNCVSVIQEPFRKVLFAIPSNRNFWNGDFPEGNKVIPSPKLIQTVIYLPFLDILAIYCLLSMWYRTRLSCVIIFHDNECEVYCSCCISQPHVIYFLSSHFN